MSRWCPKRPVLETWGQWGGLAEGRGGDAIPGHLQRSPLSFHYWINISEWDAMDDGQTWAYGNCSFHYKPTLFVWKTDHLKPALRHFCYCDNMKLTIPLHLCSVLLCYKSCLSGGLVFFFFQLYQTISGAHDSPVTSHDPSIKIHAPFSFVSPLSTFAHLISAWCICEIGRFTVTGKGTTGTGN